MGFPGGNSPASAGDSGSTPESGRSPGEGNGNSLKYSCLENPMERGAWQALSSPLCHRVGPDVATKQRQQQYTVFCALNMVFLSGVWFLYN